MVHRTYSEIAQEYDEIAHEYRDSKLLPFRDFAKSFSLFRLIGKLEGRTVLDLACGEGHYTRRLKQAGAARVLGVDISPEMIKLAEESEKTGPVGCQYSVGNAANLSLGERFDVVVGVYLLNYASSKAMLLDLCRTIYDHLKPGGVFVGINASMTLDPAKYANYQKYGLMLLTPDNRVEGDPITFVITNPDGTRFQIDNFFLRPETYAAAFADTGFCAFAWKDLWVSDTGRQQFPDGYWNAMLTDPL
jgi:ubiquinone/menaquinone biosynthesis C-methylase UbiE